MKAFIQYLKLISESIRSAYESLISNKLRSFLSVLGITIGIFLVILVFTIVDSLENNIKNSVQSLGKNVVYIDKWEWSGGGSAYPWWKYLSRPDANLQELEQLKAYPVNDFFEAVAYTKTSQNTVKHNTNKLDNVEISGYTYDFTKIETLEIEYGRFFNEFEDRNGKPVAIIGANVAKELFEKSSTALNQSINIGGKEIQVIGVFKFQGDNLINIDFDDKIAVPIQFFEYMQGQRGGGQLIVKLKEGLNEDAVLQEMRGAMRSIRRLRPIEDDNFSLNKISFLTETIGDFFKSVNAFGLIIGMFSLLVGGFGVANIMFVSVKERTNIIGIQKALGAKNSFILIQFLTEAVVLSVLGGIIGVLVTSGLATIINTLIDKMTESSFELTMSLNNVLIGLLFSMLIGLFSGLIPAYKASQLQPVEAMRSK